MENRFTRLLLILAVAAAPIGALLIAPIVLGQKGDSDTKADRYIPRIFKVYSKDGRESLTARCAPIDHNPVVNEVACNFIHVRFDPPEKRPFKLKEEIPLSVEEALKANPTLVEEARNNPKKFEQEMRKGLEEVKQEACSPKERAAVETHIRDPEMGPKRKGYYQRLLAACADKDPTVFFRRMLDLERQACGLWVYQFTLEFKKVGEGQWLYRQETPGLLSKVLKVYELTGEGLAWTLSETRVPTQGAEEKPTQTVWSWKNFGEYELPCEFISHSGVQLP